MGVPLLGLEKRKQGIADIRERKRKEEKLDGRGEKDGWLEGERKGEHEREDETGKDAK